VRKQLFALLAACLLMLSVAPAASAITWGQPDGTDHPQVVAILFEREDGYYSCTGTLLSATVVLTAGHCTEDEEGNANITTWVRNDPVIDIAGELANYRSVKAWLRAEWIEGTAIAHPEYDNFSQFPNTYDVGVVLLKGKGIVLDEAEYGQLPELNQFDYLRTSKSSPSERQVVVVGYGLQGKIPAFTQDEFTRYQGTSTIINTGESANAGPQNFVYTNNSGEGVGPGGTCSGDSGGPAFWVDPATGEETNIIVGINSYGIAPLCNGNDYQFRADIAETLEFVGQYL
jgi:secreted trypsin-like serine protease